MHLYVFSRILQWVIDPNDVLYLFLEIPTKDSEKESNYYAFYLEQNLRWILRGSRNVICTSISIDGVGVANTFFAEIFTHLDSMIWSVSIFVHKINKDRTT